VLVEKDGRPGSAAASSHTSDFRLFSSTTSMGIPSQMVLSSDGEEKAGEYTYRARCVPKVAVPILNPPNDMYDSPSAAASVRVRLSRYPRSEASCTAIFPCPPKFLLVSVYPDVGAGMFSSLSDKLL